MAASKKPAKAKGRAKFKDLKSKKNPKGGAFDTYSKVVGDSASPILYAKIT